MRDLFTILRGGDCTRWHANPDLADIRETLAEHHARVAQILLAIHPAPSLALIDAALHHDAGEPKCGDLPAPFKRENPEIARAHTDFEVRELVRLGVAPGISERDEAWLKMADRIAAFAHVAQVRGRLLECFDWREERAKIVAMAWRLDAAPQVHALMCQLAGRDALSEPYVVP
ncbi:MAG TPA: hypothetical protein VGC40_09115 [Paenirhodobacter sp.]